MERDYIRRAAGVEGDPGSPWLVADAPEYSTGCPSGRFDVAIIGGGLVGILTARHLGATGARVVLVERRRLAAGVSGHTTAKVTVQHAAGWHLLLAAHDAEALSRWALANAGAPAELEQLVGELGAAGERCGFARVPSTIYAVDDDEAGALEREAEAYGRLGLAGVSDSASAPPWRTAGPVLRMPDQAIVDPAALISACASALPPSVSIWEEAAVRSVEESDGGVVLHCDNGAVEADQVVMAGNIPTLDTAAYFSRLYQYRSYAFAIRTGTPLSAGSWIPAGRGGVNLRPAGPDSDGRWIASGVDHKAGQGGDERGCYALLATATRELIPDAVVERHWSAQDPRTADGLPFVGRAPFTKRLYMASGFGGWGMTKSFVSARLLAELVGGGKPELADLLDPGRTDPLKGLGTFVGENLETGTELLKSFVPLGRHPEAVPGAGAAPEIEVVGEGGGAEAVWHDPDDGADRNRSAHCTHMGCVLHPNLAEVTWDCPCHGSRFAADATVIHGPAREDLRPPRG